MAAATTTNVNGCNATEARVNMQGGASGWHHMAAAIGNHDRNATGLAWYPKNAHLCAADLVIPRVRDHAATAAAANSAAVSRRLLSRLLHVRKCTACASICVCAEEPQMATGRLATRTLRDVVCTCVRGGWAARITVPLLARSCWVACLVV